jgi:hypothetical protein
MTGQQEITIGIAAVTLALIYGVTVPRNSASR